MGKRYRGGKKKRGRRGQGAKAHQPQVLPPGSPLKGFTFGVSAFGVDPFGGAPETFHESMVRVTDGDPDQAALTVATNLQLKPEELAAPAAAEDVVTAREHDTATLAALAVAEEARRGLASELEEITALAARAAAEEHLAADERRMEVQFEAEMLQHARASDPSIAHDDFIVGEAVVGEAGIQAGEPAHLVTRTGDHIVTHSGERIRVR